MAKAPQKASIHKARFSDIRPFVNFKYTGTESNKRKIREIHRELAPMLAQPYTILKTSSKKNLSEAMEIAGFETKFKSIKAVPIETLGIPKARAKFKKGNLFIESEYQSIEFVKFNKRKLVRDGAKHAAELIAPRVAALAKKNKRRKNKASEAYQIAAGAHFISSTYDASILPGKISALQMKYDKGTKGSKKHGGSTYRDWMTGFRVIEVNKQNPIDETIKRWRNEKEKTHRFFKKHLKEIKSKKKAR